MVALSVGALEVAHSVLPFAVASSVVALPVAYSVVDSVVYSAVVACNVMYLVGVLAVVVVGLCRIGQVLLALIKAVVEGILEQMVLVGLDA